MDHTGLTILGPYFHRLVKANILGHWKFHDKYTEAVNTDMLPSQRWIGIELVQISPARTCSQQNAIQSSYAAGRDSPARTTSVAVRTDTSPAFQCCYSRRFFSAQSRFTGG